MNNALSFSSLIIWKTTKLYNHFNHVLRPFDALSLFFSPQVKRCALVIYKNSIYKLPHELLKNIRFFLSLHVKMTILLILAKDS